MYCMHDMCIHVYVCACAYINPWWRHQLETFSAFLAICAGNSPDSLHKGQWRGALMFSLICVWINGWENNREAGDLRHHRALYDVIVMQSKVVRLVPHAGLEDRHFDPRIRKHKLVKQNGVCILYTRFSVPYLNRKISVDVANRVRVLNNIETPYGVIYAGQDCLR